MSHKIQFQIDGEDLRRLEELGNARGKNPNALAREILLRTLSMEASKETTLKSLEELSEVLERRLGGEVLSLLQRTFNFSVSANVAIDEHIKRLNEKGREGYLDYRKTVDSRTEEALNRMLPKAESSQEKAEKTQEASSVRTRPNGGRA